MTFPARAHAPACAARPALRRLVAETRLSVDDLVAPLFVREGIDEPQPIASLPGVVQHTRESLRKEVRGPGRPRRARGHPLRRARPPRTPRAREAWDPDGIVQVALRDLRDEVGDRSCSWPTCASTSTPTTATAAC